jgi:hypothetical protein
MKKKPTYGSKIIDPDWGCEHLEVTYDPLIGKVKLCHVKVSDIEKIAVEMTEHVQNTSWMIKLDKGSKRAYDKTVAETAQKLVRIFKKAAAADEIAGDFGELIVSIGSARALAKIFNHTQVPIAELWKPQAKQNEGFDIHTVCRKEIINFGEAKYSSNGTPHGKAMSQANDFINRDKHYRDRVHLINLVSDKAIENLDDEMFGIIASFSLNAANPLTVLKNALSNAQKLFSSDNIKSVYLVGVSH